MRWFVLVAASGATVACSDSTRPTEVVGPLRVQPAAPEYSAGATASLTVTNLAGEPVVQR